MDPEAGRQQAAVRASLDLGGLLVERVVDLEDTPFSLFDIYPDAKPEHVPLLGRLLDARTFEPESGNLLLSFHSILVRVGGSTILVDTCCGNDKRRAARPAWDRRDGPFLANLAAAGVRPEEVDFVMCTHLHADHVGWNTRLVDGRWVPTFPNAQYLFAEAEYAHWKAAHERAAPEAPILYGSFADSVLPVVRSGQAVMVGPTHSPVTGVHLEPVPGHTPGNVMVRLEGSRSRAVCSGDVVHHPAQFVFPDWSTRFCTDPAQSRESRRQFVERTADTADYVLPAHFQEPSFGRIVRDGRRYRFLAP